MAALKANEVFVPNRYPQHTYVVRQELDVERLVREGLETPGQIVSLSGPSKSGKTVLVERVVSRDKLTVVTGAQISTPESFWELVLNELGEPHQSSASDTSSHSGAATVSGKGKIGIPLVAEGEIGSSGTLTSGGQKATGISVGRRGMTQVIELLADSDRALLLDDFHYIPRDVQEKVAKQLKEAVRQGVRIVVASVTHRSDDMVRALPDLRGRVLAVDLPYWDQASLKRIAEIGFAKLNVEIDPAFLDTFAIESVGSPQLMQTNCLNACFELKITEAGKQKIKATLTPDTVHKVLQRTARTADYRTLVELLEAGPKARAADRNVYKWRGGGSGDVYACVLRALALDPVLQSFKYQDLLQRIQLLCDGTPPPGSTVTTTCQQLAKIAQDNRAESPVLEWDEEKSVLDIVDPYLLFYLRWAKSPGTP